ncbi:MAG: DUF4412 domain-containing protein, partial [Candidatus Methylomirabilis sp.]|nr:DUF4412 domain-containing protein [Deltaproteobacteria bacterium]
LLGAVVDWFPGVEGFPLRSEARSVTKEVTKLETGPVDPARFAIPKGYAMETPEAFLAAKAPPRKP